MANQLNICGVSLGRAAPRLQLRAESRRLFHYPALVPAPADLRDWRRAGFWLRGTRGAGVTRLGVAAEAAAVAADLPRFLALWSDVTAGRRTDLRTLWDDLAAGGLKVFDTFYTDDRCYSLLAPSSDPSPISADRLRLLQRVMLGHSQKALAIELGVSPSTVTSTMKAALKNIGLECRTSAAPALLIMAACAHHAGVSAEGRTSRFEWRRQRCIALSAPRPDRHLAVSLTEAESVVARLLVEGQSYAEIARARATSPRTVANQLSALFRKLNVSGRNELIVTLLQR